MKAITLGLAALGSVIGGGIWFTGENDGEQIYDMPLAAVQTHLAGAQIDHFIPIFDGANISVSSHENKVTWRGELPKISVKCDAILRAVSKTRTAISSVCESKSQTDYLKNTINDALTIEFNEFLSASLEGRPYNKDAVDLKKLAIFGKNQQELHADLARMTADTDRMLQDARRIDAETSEAIQERMEEMAAQQTDKSKAMPETTDLSEDIEMGY